MLGDICEAKNIYIICGYTDMRKGINGLVPFIQQHFKPDPYQQGLFFSVANAGIDSRRCFGNRTVLSS